VIGFEVNQALIQNLEGISQLDIRVEVDALDETPFSVATKEIPSTATVVNVSQGDSVEWLSFLLWDRDKLIESDFMFVERNDLEVRIVLSTTVERLFSSFLSLIFNITLIALFAVIAAIGLTAIISRQMTRPIEKLTQVATNIAKGEYQEGISIDIKSQELAVLADSFKTMQTNIREREEKIIHQAQHDDLTCLYNRNHIEAKLGEKFASKECFQAVGINIFGFRDINDTFGYHNGDVCLRELANRVRDLGGLAARLTGGELIWIPEKPVSESEVVLIRDNLEKEIFVDDLSIPMRISVGIIECPSDTHNAEDLFRRMNIVLDEAQNTDEKLLRFHASFENSYLRRLSIITELKKALSTNQHELQLFYQPKMELSSDKILGVEALIRWQNDSLGFISPEDFIAIAEQAGFINKITEWVYQQAVKDVCLFRSEGVNVVVAINISAQDVMNPEQLTMINNLLDTNGLPAEALSFELTEGDLIKDPEQALQHLGYLRSSGFSIAIDDFGTGYSSLAYLTQLPINVLKIDKSFVLNLDTSKDDQTIVQTVIKLAHSFGMEVVAEGVENAESLALLKKWGCEWAQGYYICRPIAAPDLIEWYKERESKLAS
jgi:diguanylate cyclase (GGDEF)-like protein